MGKGLNTLLILNLIAWVMCSILAIVLAISLVQLTLILPVSRIAQFYILFGTVLSYSTLVGLVLISFLIQLLNIAKGQTLIKIFNLKKSGGGIG